MLGLEKKKMKCGLEPEHWVWAVITRILCPNWAREQHFVSLKRVKPDRDKMGTGKKLY